MASAYRLQNSNDDSADVESVYASESEQMLASPLSTAQAQDTCLRLPRTAARAALVAGVAVGVLIACTMGSFAIGRAVNPKAAGVKNVVRLNEDDDIWASVLGPKAKEAFDKQVASAAAEISVKTDEPIPTHAPIPEVVAPTPAPAPVYVAPPVT
ncbi:unnamed protein product, partial [Polarella glacialis]